MEHEKKPYAVFVKIDKENRITAVDSSAFLRDTDGWVEIDSGYGEKYAYAQSDYFPKPIMDERGIYRYKLEDGKPVERTQEEMDADYVPPVQKPSEDERITALEEALTAIVEGIASV